MDKNHQQWNNGDTANSTGLKRQIWNKNEELNQQVWRSTLKKKHGFLTNTKGLQRYTYGNPSKKYVKFDYDLANPMSWATAIKE